MSKPTLIHRGYLYAQKRAPVPKAFPPPHEHRMQHAITWRAGYMAAKVDARRRAAKSR